MPSRPSRLCAALGALSLFVGPAAFAQTAIPAPPPATSTKIVLHGHVPALEANSTLEGPVAATQTFNLALTLPLRDPQGLSKTLNALYDVADPIHGQFLTPQQFADRFAPTQAQYAAVAAYAQSKGLTVTGTHPNRLVLDVQGSAATVEQAFGLHLNCYLSPSGREFFGPDTDPSVDASMTGLVLGVIGLDAAAVPHPAVVMPNVANSLTNSVNTIGSGALGGLTPSKEPRF